MRGGDGSDGEVGKADDNLEEGKAKDNNDDDVNDSYHAEALAMLASIEEKFALLRDCVHFNLTRNNTLSSSNPLPNCGPGFLILTYTTYHVKLLTLTYNA